MRWLTFLPAVTFAACVGSDPGVGSGPTGDAGTSSDGSADGSTPNPGNEDAAATSDGGLSDGPTSNDPQPPLPTPQLWLDARKVGSGAVSTTWPDSSGNGADAVGSIAITAENSSINGRPAMRFLSEANQGMRVPANKLSLVLADGFAIFLVARAFPKSPAPTFPTLVERLTSPNRNGIWIWWQVPASPIVRGDLLSYASPLPNDVGTSITDATIFDPHVYAMRVSAGVLTFTVDGAMKMSTPLAADNTNFPANNTVPFTVGGSSSETGADYGFSGYIGSVSVYSRTVDDTTLAAGVAKLKSDWGIP
jgi:hypothetical protein